MYKKRIFGLLVLGSEMVNFPLRIWEYFVLKNCHSEGQLALEVESLSERFCLLLKCYFITSIKEKSDKFTQVSNWSNEFRYFSQMILVSNHRSPEH